MKVTRLVSLKGWLLRWLATALMARVKYNWVLRCFTWNKYENSKQTKWEDYNSLLTWLKIAQIKPEEHTHQN